jgi:glycosyltransferase involved in cell wall biosynthesis
MSDASRPHLLVVSGTWPCLNGHAAAANVVGYQILSALAATNRFKLSFICAGELLVTAPAAAAGDLAKLRAAGVTLLPPTAIPVTRLRRRALATVGNLSLQRWEWIMKGYGQHRWLVDAIGGSLPDGVLTIWSEFASAVVGGLLIPKFAYYGNLEYRNIQAQQLLAEIELAGRGAQTTPLQRARNAALVAMARRGHYGLLRKFERVWNVAKVDADEQRAGGIKTSYVSNTWPADPTRPVSAERSRDVQTRPLKIVGSVGRMAATANSFGLLSLSREILPALKTRLGDGNFEIHLYGRPPPRNFVAAGLQDPHFKLRGFVEDLEAEMMSAPVFLVANNHDKYKAGHTRILHAWSLGCCVIAAEDIRLAMPELVHDENILLGRTADDMAALVARAGADATLRERIGAGGRRTLAESFNSHRVAGAIADDIMTSLQQR